MAILKWFIWFASALPVLMAIVSFVYYLVKQRGIREKLGIPPKKGPMRAWKQTKEKLEKEKELLEKNDKLSKNKRFLTIERKRLEFQKKQLIENAQSKTKKPELPIFENEVSASEKRSINPKERLINIEMRLNEIDEKLRKIEQELPVKGGNIYSYISLRIDPTIVCYSSKATSSSIFYTCIIILQITYSAMIPVVLLVTAPDANNNYPSIISAILGAFVTVASTINASCKFKEKWLQYIGLRDKLFAERNIFTTDTKNDDGWIYKNGKRYNFVENCESIIALEHKNLMDTLSDPEELRKVQTGNGNGNDNNNNDNTNDTASN